MRKNDNGEPAACACPPACPPAGAPGRQPPFRVMIADPDPIMRKALAEIVARTEGFEVTHSLGGVDGVPELYRKDSPDVVFVDLVIPWLSGVDAARGILGADPGAQVYGIFPYDHFDLSEHASGVRLAGHIQKPVSREQVEGILAGHRRARAPKGSLQLSVLSEIVSVRDFGGFYGRSYDIAVSLQEEAGRDSRSVRAKLRDIQSALSGGGPAEPGGPAFSASEPVLLSIDAVVQLCLFNIVNGVFTADSVRFNSLLKNLFRFLDRNVTRRIGLDDLAEKCCISQGHLSRLFRKCFNISVMEYIHMRKLTLSKAYLLFTDYSVSEVADIVGYNERSYFSKLFKKFDKMTVQHYRQTNNRADTMAALASGDCQRFVSDAFGIAL